MEVVFLPGLCYRVTSYPPPKCLSDRRSPVRISRYNMSSVNYGSPLSENVWSHGGDQEKTTLRENTHAMRHLPQKHPMRITPLILEDAGENGCRALGINQERQARCRGLRASWLISFFAIPGCVLSARGLKLVKHGKMSEFLSSLISSVFMRWLRWHLRVIASMCIALFISRMEW